MQTPGGDLLERAEQLERIDDVLSTVAAGTGGGLVVIPAAAGLGKTTLLEATVAHAAPGGVRVLLARASELESKFAFGVARQLFEPAVLAAGEAERAELLAGAARHAAAVLDLDPEAGADRDVHTTLHGLYWLLSNLATDAPLLVAVDDVQWADEPSVRWLAYAARRLERLPLAIVLAIRTDPDGGPAVPPGASPGLREALEELMTSTGALRLSPGPLSAGATADLIAAALGQVPDSSFAETCRQQTGGNAFLISELVAELAADEVAPTRGNAARLANVVPERVGETIRRHLGRVSPEARELATSLAVAGDGTELDLVAQLAGMDVTRAARAAAELVSAQVLADSREPRFRHPLLRTAVEGESPEMERATRHGHAAELLEQRGAPSGRVASHLLASPPGGGRDWAVARLRAAASSARSQGATAQAVALLSRALAEPPPAGDRAAVLRELGEAEHAVLDPAAEGHLRDALELTENLAERVDIVHMLTTSLYYAGHNREAVEVGTRASAQARDADTPELREQWLALEALIGLVGRYSLATEEQTRGRLQELAGELAGDTPGERQVLAAAESERRVTTAQDLYESNVRVVQSWRETASSDPAAGIGAVAMFVHAGRPEAAGALAGELFERARASGSPTEHSVALATRVLVALDAGNLPSAREDVEAAYAIWRDTGKSTLLRTGASFYLESLTGLGELNAAEGLLDEYDLAGKVPELMFYNPLLYRRGVLHLERRRFAEAEHDFRELARRFEIWNIDRPVPPWRSGAARALMATGRNGEARALAEAELQVAQRWGTPKPIAVAIHTGALAAGGPESIAELTRALGLLEDTVWRLDRARIRLDLGAALRRDGRRRDARAALTLAMDEAHACGARPLAALAADELRASGARPRRRAITGVDALTPSELRVADLAASGRTNREIAQELFITMGTVETHLGRVYRKLDVAGREALGGSLKPPG